MVDGVRRFGDGAGEARVVDPAKQSELAEHDVAIGECLVYAPAAIASARRGNWGLKPRSSRMRRPSSSASKARPRSASEPSGGGAPTDANTVARSGASSSTTL